MKDSLDIIMLTGSLKFRALENLVGSVAAYAYRCVQCEYTMRFSEALLMECIDCSVEKDQWNSFFKAHLEEERGHHEWAKTDLDNLRSLVSVSWEVSPYTVQSVSDVQAAVASNDFLSLIGYSIAVECYQGTEKAWLAYMTKTGLPEHVFTNAVKHSNIDCHHGHALLTLVDAAHPLEQKAIWDTALRTGLHQMRSFEWALQMAQANVDRMGAALSGDASGPAPMCVPYPSAPVQIS